MIMPKKNSTSENELQVTKNEIAARIKKFRKDQKLTQRALGDMLGINFQHVSKYERGEFIPTFENMLKFIKHYSLNINWLLTGEGEMYIDLKPRYPLSEDQVTEIFRDGDEKLGEIVNILQLNEKLKDAIYELLKTFQTVNQATEQFHKIVEELLVDKLQKQK